MGEKEKLRSFGETTYQTYTAKQVLRIRRRRDRPKRKPGQPIAGVKNLS